MAKTAVMPQDYEIRDEIGAPALPRLCRDHVPVIGNAKHLDGIAQTAVTNARAERARQCPDCFKLNWKDVLDRVQHP